MKLIHKDVDKGAQGSIVLYPEESEDMWHAYNLLSVGDILKSMTIRKVQSESATGTTSSSKIRTTLSIQIESIDFDTIACALRVKGRNVEENKHVKMGAYHTLDLEKNKKFTLFKTEWDSVSLDRVETACDPAQSADVAAVIMQEGVGHVCLVTPSMTLVRSKVDYHIPRKRKGVGNQYSKAMQKFYDQMIQAMERHLNFEVLKCVLLASPGFVKDDFYRYLMNQAVKVESLKIFLDNKSKFTFAKSTSGFKHSLRGVLEDPNVQQLLSDTKAISEVKALDDFYEMLQNDPGRAFYGIKHVEAAAAVQAVELLLVSDALFRATDIKVRKRYVRLVDDVKESGGEVRVFSSLHVSGEQLLQLSGIAALLRFPMPEPEEGWSSDEEENLGAVGGVEAANGEFSENGAHSQYMDSYSDEDGDLDADEECADESR
ncbi:DgyrCDS9337 [Dimorphilus gyrociliatus]|uniref:Protein pelota homolog n=1 Tax=Dimorphilus gyrociliatus TaxID=2664684 RepID=A0A7I8VWP7_9ANNE|nr:DgyrCDS9337 [Dimorphilus gyrociliatus]